jgi:hypothetical protein
MQTFPLLPNHNMHLQDIIGNEKILDFIRHWFDLPSNEHQMVRISGAKGDGSSLILHAFANALQNKEEIGFIQFKVGDKFSLAHAQYKLHLTSKHYVFFDNLHHLLVSEEEIDNITELINELSSNDISVFYSCDPNVNCNILSRIDAGFKGKKHLWHVERLDSKQKKIWAAKLLSNAQSAAIPLSWFETNEDNFSFRERLEPMIQERMRVLGLHTEELNEQLQQLTSLEFELLTLRLQIIELDAQIKVDLRKQLYEIVSNSRSLIAEKKDNIKNILQEIETIPVVESPSSLGMKVFRLRQHLYDYGTTILENA